MHPETHFLVSKFKYMIQVQLIALKTVAKKNDDRIRIEDIKGN